MMNTIKSWLASKDSLGTQTNINYQSNTMYGTVIGGICCILVNLFTLLFAVPHIASIFLNPQYTQTFGTELSREPVEIDIREGFPLISVPDITKTGIKAYYDLYD